MLHGNRIFVFFAPSKTKCVDKHKPFEADEMPSSGHRLVQKRRKPPRNRELSTRQIVANLTSIDGLGERIRTSGLLNPIQARYQTALHPDIHLLPQSEPLDNIRDYTSFSMICQAEISGNGETARKDFSFRTVHAPQLIGDVLQCLNPPLRLPMPAEQLPDLLAYDEIDHNVVPLI